MRAMILAPAAAVAALAAAGCHRTARPAEGGVSGKGAWAVSLRVLQRRLADGREDGDPGHLAGLRYVRAIVADPEHNDVLLVGSADGPCRLYTEDLAVGLRAAFGRYGRREGNTIYLSAPAVSIDPDPRVIGALRRSLAAAGARPDEDDLAEFRRIAATPQATRVEGMPHDCRPAQVALERDHYLKRYTNGTAAPAIPGWESLFDRRMRLASGSGGGASAMDRFWFTSARVTYLEDAGVAVVNAVPVELKTEAEALGRDRLVGMGRCDPVAGRWAAEFSRAFARICALEPRFADLAAIYRQFAIAQVVHRRADEFRAESVLAFLLDEYRVPSRDVPGSLPGLSRVERKEYPFVRGAQTGVAYVCHTSCGGVDLMAGDLAPKRDGTGRSRAMASQAVAARPAQEALFWPVAQ